MQKTNVKGAAASLVKQLRGSAVQLVKPRHGSAVPSIWFNCLRLPARPPRGFLSVRTPRSPRATN